MKKSVVLAIVIGIMFVISALALAALYLLTQESRIAEHKIRRMRVFYAARAGAVHAVEEIRKGNITVPGGADNFNIGDGILGYPLGGLDVEIEVGDLDTSGGVTDGTYPLEVTASY